MSHADYEVIDETTGELVSVATGNAVTTRQSAVARREMVGGLLRPVAAPQEILRAQEEIREVIAQTLKKGRDYDMIPGTKKDTMLQPGAERSAAAFGLAPEFEIIEQEIDHDRPIHYVKRSKKWNNRFQGDKTFEWVEESGQSEGLYRYVLRCKLVHRESGVVVGEGVGSCSTLESKYIDRPRDLENTVLKMAKKRGYVDAVLTTLGLHDQFTQDVEDNPEAFGLGGNSEAVKPVLERVVGFGKKHPENTWAEVVKVDPGYVEWAIENVDKLSQADKDDLTRALNRTDDGTGDAQELDRLADGVRLMIEDIRKLDPDRATKAEGYAHDVLAKEGVTPKDIQRLGAATLAVLRQVQAKRESATEKGIDLPEEIDAELAEIGP